jgi:hypothetical protein
LLFVLLGGAALIMISFPGAEIGRAILYAFGKAGSYSELQRAAHFWEASARGFWLMGGLQGVLCIVIGFNGMAYVETAGIASIMPMLSRSVVSIFYGCLLAAICFVSYWKIMSKIHVLQPETCAIQSQIPAAGKLPRLFAAIAGYIIVLALLVLTFWRTPSCPGDIWNVYRPSLLVVLGGTIVILLFVGSLTTKLTPSAAFGGMGLIGALMGCIQMLHGFADATPQGISIVAGALAFVLSSCFTALLGMALIGAPIEDRAIRSGRVASMSPFSRVSWYVFPLLSLFFLVLVFCMIVMPMPAAH